MSNTLKALAGIGIAVLLCGRASAQGSGKAANEKGPVQPAQGLVSQRAMSLTMAKAIAEGALAECQQKGYHTAVAVVDRAGQVMVILRDEQASAQQVEMARRKAYTAKMWRTTTLEFQKRTQDPGYAAQREVGDTLALGGGAPIIAGNDVIGGVGSSGSSQPQDDACAKAGIAKVADLLK